MKKSSWIYGIWLAMFMVVAIRADDLIRYFRSLTAVNYNMWYGLGGTYLIYLAIGFLLGLDYLMHELSKSGRLCINMAKLLWAGIPCLLTFVVTIGSYWGYNLWPSTNFCITYLPSRLFLWSALLLGNVLATSFYRQTEIKANIAKGSEL